MLEEVYFCLAESSKVALGSWEEDDWRYEEEDKRVWLSGVVGFSEARV